MPGVSAADLALEYGITAKAVSFKARQLGISPRRVKGQRWEYRPGDVSRLRAHIAATRRAPSIDETLGAVQVPTATLRRWYLEDRFAVWVIAGWLSICSDMVHALAEKRGIGRRRVAPSAIRCGCGRLLVNHPRCPRCEVLVNCPYTPANGPGPLCVWCLRDLRVLAQGIALARIRSIRP